MATIVDLLDVFKANAAGPLRERAKTTAAIRTTGIVHRLSAILSTESNQMPQFSALQGDKPGVAHETLSGLTNRDTSPRTEGQKRETSIETRNN